MHSFYNQVVNDIKTSIKISINNIYQYYFVVHFIIQMHSFYNQVVNDICMYQIDGMIRVLIKDPPLLFSSDRTEVADSRNHIKNIYYNRKPFANKGNYNSMLPLSLA